MSVMTFKTTDGRSYTVDELGVIHQTDARPFVYDKEYVDRYCAPEYAAQAVALSSLRLGWVIGVFNRNFSDRPYSLLDVGYGTGAFMREAAKFIDQVDGLEKAPVPVPTGCRRVAAIEQDYDVVTFWDSLEHHADLGFVRHIRAMLVAISVPWCHGWSGDAFEQWKHRKPDEHLHHFSPAALAQFMYSIGWRIVAQSDHEDIIRLSEDNGENILTAAFVKRWPDRT